MCSLGCFERSEPAQKEFPGKVHVLLFPLMHRPFHLIARG